MATPPATRRQRSPAAGSRIGPPATRATRTRQGAAIAIRKKPTSSGDIGESRATSFMVEPVVPQVTAASTMRTTPAAGMRRESLLAVTGESPGEETRGGGRSGGGARPRPRPGVAVESQPLPVAVEAGGRERLEPVGGEDRMVLDGLDREPPSPSLGDERGQRRRP